MPIHIEPLWPSRRMRADVRRFPLGFFRNSKMGAPRFEHFQYLLAIHCAIVEQIVTAIVNEYEKMIQHICISKVTHL